MLSVDISIAFPRQLEEYALFIDDNNDVGLTLYNYVRIAFWVKTPNKYIPCIQIDNDFLEVDLTNFYGEFQSVVSKHEVEEKKSANNVKIIG